MKQIPHKLKMNGAEPCVDQGHENLFHLSWNPDDGRFYVVAGEKTKAVFARFSNAVQYARTHQVEAS